MLFLFRKAGFCTACFLLLFLCLGFCLTECSEIRKSDDSSRTRLIRHLKSEILDGKLNELLDKQTLESVGARERMEERVLDTYGTFLIEEYERLTANPKVPTKACTRKLNTIGHDCLQP